MKKKMSLSEMKDAFPSEWLLILDPETDETHGILNGIVDFHSKDRDEMYRYAVAKKPKRFATLYTGTLPENSAVIL